MTSVDSRKTHRKRYRLKVQEAMLKLKRIATLDQLVEELATQMDDVCRKSVRQMCDSYCVNGSGRHNQHHRPADDSNYHFLLKVAPGVYAMPDPKYLDLAAVFIAHRQRAEVTK